jgi:iron-sulfur cluster assembly accessory protein
MAVHDENLDDVISSLIDIDEEEEEQNQPIEKSSNGIPVTLTPRAAKQIRRIREKEEIGDNLFLRVAVEGGGCAGLNYKLGFDFKNEEDTDHLSEGIEIVIDPKHLMYLDGIVIDYPDGLDARGFTFDNPNASENCGCGSSFAI